MLDKIINTEIEYIKQFSESIHGESIYRFSDENIPDMYTHNFTLILKDTDLKQIILNEINERKKIGMKFLRIETNFPIKEELINNLPIIPEVSIYDYMYIETNKFKFLKGNPVCRIKQANTLELLQDGINVDILANEKAMGNEFALRRIRRKTQIYNSPNTKVNLFVCFYNKKPIGNCELMLHDGIAKIEDFDILDTYQRKGFGTSVLKHLLEVSVKSEIDIAYLITDSSDTAKEMYKKCGFSKIGEKTELFFNL